MCGIVGYVGYRDGKPIILDGLRRLEYRGYDSAGLVLLEKAGSALPPLPAIAGPLTCVVAFMLLAMRQREERLARQMADRLH